MEVDGRQVAYRGVDEFFGEMGLIDNTPRNADVIADGHLTVVQLMQAGAAQAPEASGVWWVQPWPYLMKVASLDEGFCRRPKSF